MNIQEGRNGLAKAYQVRQVIKALEKLQKELGSALSATRQSGPSSTWSRLRDRGATKGIRSLPTCKCCRRLDAGSVLQGIGRLARS